MKSVSVRMDLKTKPSRIWYDRADARWIRYRIAYAIWRYSTRQWLREFRDDDA